MAILFLLGPHEARGEKPSEFAVVGQAALATAIHAFAWGSFMTPVLSCSDSEPSLKRCGLPLAAFANFMASSVSSTAIWWMGAIEEREGRWLPTFLVELGGVGLGTALLYANAEHEWMSPAPLLFASALLPPLFGAVGFHGLELRIGVSGDEQAASAGGLGMKAVLRYPLSSSSSPKSIRPERK